MNEEYLWVEKYRPKTVKDTILPEKLKFDFQKILDSGQLPNMLFTGTAGLGKTTVAKALCNELDLDHIVINASDEGNIDTLRGKIKQFASSVSLHGGVKVVILDEADYLNCLEENEEVLLGDGTYIKLKDMDPDFEYKVISFNPTTNQFESDKASVINKDEKEVFEIEMEDGRKIKATEDHPFMVVDPDGNVSQRTIKEGFDGVEIILKK